MSHPIPENFARICVEMNGEKGKKWLVNLPAKITDLERRWDIQVLAPFELSYNYVAPAVRSNGERVVLKLGFPNRELTSEIAALRHYGGKGIVKLIEGDPEAGVMLMEYLEPGVPLLNHPDPEEATRIAAQVMQELWISAPHDPDHQLITVADWSFGLKRLRAEFGDGTGPFPKHLVEWAESLYAELSQSAGPAMLLHGDLHHWNILSAQRAPWLALDPKGLIGEPEYEVGAFLRNPSPERDSMLPLIEWLPRRLDIFHEMLGFDRQRMLGWSLYQAVLSSWWTYEDHHRISKEMLAFAEGHLELLQ
jgi:streptomycin 6-kinase